MYAAGMAICLNATGAKDRVGVYALWSLLILLFALYFASTFGPLRPSVRICAEGALALWLTVPWAAWADRHRLPS